MMNGETLGYGVGIAAVFMFAIREFFAYLKNKNGHSANGAAIEIMRNLASVMSEEQKTSAKICQILEDIRDTNKQTAQKLVDVSGKIDISMERQQKMSQVVEQIRERL